MGSWDDNNRGKWHEQSAPRLLLKRHHIKLLTGKSPFEEIFPNEPAFSLALCKDQIKVEDANVLEGAPSELFDAVSRCLSIVPGERPSSFELYTIMSNTSGEWALEEFM